jgi:hypothetical protein
MNNIRLMDREKGRPAGPDSEKYYQNDNSLNSTDFYNLINNACRGNGCVSGRATTVQWKAIPDGADFGPYAYHYPCHFYFNGVFPDDRTAFNLKQALLASIMTYFYYIQPDSIWRNRPPYIHSTDMPDSIQIVTSRYGEGTFGLGHVGTISYKMECDKPPPPPSSSCESNPIVTTSKLLSEWTNVLGAGRVSQAFGIVSLYCATENFFQGLLSG